METKEKTEITLDLNAFSFVGEETVSRLMRSTKGRVFSGMFVKKDGSVRTFNARATAENAVLGTGSERKLAFIDNAVLIRNLKNGMDKVTARQKSWRSFRLEGLLELTIDGTTYKFEQ